DSRRLDSAIAAAQIEQKAASTGQTSLFDMFGGGGAAVAPPMTPAVNGVEAVSARERALWEKEVLGFQFGDHPFMEAAAWLSGQLSHDTSEITGDAAGGQVVRGGRVTGTRGAVTRSQGHGGVLTTEALSRGDELCYSRTRCGKR